MRKILATFLVLALCISMGIPSEAHANTNIRESNKNNVSLYVLDFVKSIYRENNYKTGDTIEILDESDCLSGYCIDIMYYDSPYGYVVVKFSENQPVVSEFCIEKDVQNPFETIIRNHSIVSYENLKFYSIGLNDYQIYDFKERVMYGISEKKSFEEFEKFKKYYAKYKNEMFLEYEKKLIDHNSKKGVNYSSLDGWTVISDSYTGTYVDSDVIDGAYNISYYCTSDVTNAGLTYACSVVALSNLMKYYRYKGKTNIDSNFSTLYSSLWTYAGTTSTGSTSNGNEAPAAVSYMSSKGYSISYDDYWWDWFSSFVQDTEDDRPMLFTYGAYFGADLGGHATFCVGYVETSDYDYLIVADGWNSYLRYINFNGYSYTRKDGWSFTTP